MSKVTQAVLGFVILFVALVCFVTPLVTTDQVVYNATPPTATATTEPTCRVHGVQWDGLSLRVMWVDPNRQVHTTTISAVNWELEEVPNQARGAYPEEATSGLMTARASETNFVIISIEGDDNVRLVKIC